MPMRCVQHKRRRVVKLISVFAGSEIDEAYSDGIEEGATGRVGLYAKPCNIVVREARWRIEVVDNDYVRVQFACARRPPS